MLSPNSTVSCHLVVIEQPSLNSKEINCRRLCFAGFGHVKTPLETTNFGSSGLLQLIVFTSIGKPYSPSTTFSCESFGTN